MIGAVMGTVFMTGGGWRREGEEREGGVRREGRREREGEKKEKAEGKGERMKAYTHISHRFHIPSY